MASCSMAKIGPFEILELVGRGAMGAVYRAVDTVIGRVVAIKVIRLIGYNDGDEAAFLKDRLFKEARAAGGLTHPGIVTVYQLGSQDNEAYIVMEYIDGSTLESRLTPGTPADPLLRSRVLKDVAAALDYAHSRGIVHRDIKPANIMLTGPPDGIPGAVKITDFGIAKTLLGHTVSQTGAILGTPFYMSPEQVCGMALDGRSDQFALAVIAYQMLTGRRPFEGEQVTSICYQIVHAEPSSPVIWNPELPQAVAEVLDRALHKDPAKRFPTCTEFAAALEYACEHGDAKAASESMLGTILLPPAAAPRKPRSRLFSTFVIAGCLAALTLCAWFFAPTIGKQPPLDGSAAGSMPQAEVPAPAVPDGRIIWTGRATRGTLLRLEGGHASTGKLYGALPGEPVELNILPAERSSRLLTVFTADERYATPVNITTAAGRAAFSWDPRHVMDLTLSESPGPGNGWRSLVLRVNSPQVTAFIVEWKRKAK